MILVLSFFEYLLGFVLTPFFFKRYFFEKKYCSEFHFQADYCFEFSSEGEFARIKPLVIEHLKQGKKIELIFCSQSVAESITALAFEYKKQIRYRAYPFFYRGVGLSKWITAPELGLVRYDFFPRLLRIGSLRKKFVLYSASARYLEKPFLKNVYKLFSKVIAASPLEAKQISTFVGKEVEFREYRIDEINNRLAHAEEKIREKIPCASELLNYLKTDSKEKMILGSSWSDEMQEPALQKLLESGAEQFFIFPHDKEDLANTKRILKEKGEVGELKDFRDSRFIIVGKRGVLCEFYSFFSKAYVGGGFRKSVHSVLEPMLAGCEVCVGPRIEKSSEYLYMKSLYSERISILR